MSSVRVQWLQLILLTLFMAPSWAEMSCPHCGFKNNDKDRYCLSCNGEIREITAKEKKQFSKLEEAKRAHENGDSGWVTPQVLGWGLAGLALLFLVITPFLGKSKKSKDKEEPPLSAQIHTAMSTPAGTEARSVRRYTRTQVNLKIQYQIGEDSSKKAAELFDLTLTGAGIYVSEKVEPKTKIVLYLSAPEGEIKYTGTVVKSKETDKRHLLGIQFFHLFKNQEDFISSIIAKNK